MKTTLKKAAIAAIFGLFVMMCLLGLAHYMGKSRGIAGSLNSSEISEMARKDDYHKLLDATVLAQDSGTQKWDDTVSRSENFGPIVDERYWRNGVELRNLGVYHTYPYFVRNAPQLVAAIRSANFLAKEQNIFSGDLLNDYARKQSLQLLSLREPRSRDASALFGFMCLIATGFATFFFGLSFLIMKFMRPNWRRLDILFRASLCALSMAATFVFSATDRTWCDAFDSTGNSQHPQSDSWISGLIDRYTKDWDECCTADSNGMFFNILRDCETLPAGSKVLVLAGNKHATDFQRLFATRADWAPIKR